MRRPLTGELKERSMRKQQTWLPQAGEQVELRRQGRLVRRGTIDAVMHDYSGFWLAADGIDPRVYVDIEDPSVQIWAGSPPPSLSETEPQPEQAQERSR
jgi:hypothetical protein